MADIIQIRRDSAANWTAEDPVLAHGEMGWETDTGSVKIGDGVTEWTLLPYGGIVGPEGPQGPTGATGATGAAGADGSNGVGVPAGGTTGQALTKVNATDYNTQWSTLPAASTSITLTSGEFRRAALTGDVTASANSNATTIANNAVTNAKAADMAQATIKGRASGAGTGDPTDLSASQVRTILNVADGATAGATWGTNLASIPANITSWAGITPADKVSNGGGASTLRVLTQATYDGIGTPDANTVYVIVG